MFFMAVLSVPSYVFYFSGNESDSSNYLSLRYDLAAFSLGNIGQCKIRTNKGLAEYACNSGQLSEGYINLYCPYGTLDNITEFGQTSTNSTISCSSTTFQFTPDYCSYQNSSYGYQNLQYINQVFNETCFG